MGLAEVPPAERGATRIADRVIAKLAARAAREALPAAPAMPHARASVRRHPGADGGGGIAHVRVTVELRYPSDIGAQCGAVRRQVTLRLGELAGMELTDVAVDVERLHSEHLLRGAAERRVR
nr:alkaline shock response membrane anchor protein AmaP [Streptomyces aidingensis]